MTAPISTPMSARDAVLALRSRLRTARVVQESFRRRGVPHAFPVALSIEEAEALATALTIPPGHIACPDCDGGAAGGPFDWCGRCDDAGFVPDPDAAVPAGATSGAAR